MKIIHKITPEMVVEVLNKINFIKNKLLIENILEKYGWYRFRLSYLLSFKDWLNNLSKNDLKDIFKIFLTLK